jgi:hypothetical protein
MASFCSDLHTEIAKVAKTDLELEEATIGGWSRSFVISVCKWPFLIGFTHEDRKGR